MQTNPLFLGIPLDLRRAVHYDINYLCDFLAVLPLPVCPLRAGKAWRTLSHIELRHDVDHCLQSALAMAVVEQRHGFASSYYFLPPDGITKKRNYFGSIEKDRIRVSRRFIETALAIQEMGHEVGLHNDLIPLAAATGAPIADLLAALLHELRKHGLHVTGTASHGSPLCRRYGFVNYDIFEKEGERERERERKRRVVQIDGKTVSIPSLNMQDFGLDYEAYSRPFDLYISDSRNNLYLYCPEKKPINLTPTKLKRHILSNNLPNKNIPIIIQSLIHPDHWSPICNADVTRHHVFLEGIQDIYLKKRLEERRFLIRNRENILYHCAMDTVSSYEVAYGTEASHFSGQRAWLDMLAPHLRPTIHTVLELGCGQGELLALVMRSLDATGGGPRLGVGVDASYAAIADCAVRYPHLRWAHSPCEDFIDKLLARAAEVGSLPPRFDLILDKTGMTAIPDFPTAFALLKKLSYCLAPGGRYIYMASPGFYERRYADKALWPLSWLEICQRVFPHARCLRNDGALLYEFANEPLPIRNA